jgi:hypothetical protein
MVSTILYGLPCRMIQNLRLSSAHANCISIAMVRRYWCWQERLLQKSSGKINSVRGWND